MGGRKKEIQYYRGSLKGSYLTDEDCMRLDRVLELSENNKPVTDFKHIIYDLPEDDVQGIIASRDNSFLLEKPIGELSDLQTTGAAYMYFAKRAVIGDSVGLGKTVEICGLCNYLELENAKEGVDFRALILTEKNLVNQVRSEFVRFTGNFYDAVYGTKSSVSAFLSENADDLRHSIVGSHSLLNSVAFQEFFNRYDVYYGVNPFDILVIDESAVVGESKTQTYKNAETLAKRFDRILLLNATSFESHLMSFYNQLNLADPSFLPTKGAFSDRYEIKTIRYGTSYSVPSGKYKNAEEFRSLAKYRYIKRTRKGSGAVMENCSATLVPVNLTKEQKDLLKRTSIPAMVYDCPGYFGMGIETNIETTPKLGALLGLVEEELKTEKTVLIYSRYKESQGAIYNVLEEAGYNSAVMNGDTPLATRNLYINQFKEGSLRVLITNVQKGLNFGNCNVCIFYTYDPNPSKMVQFEGRTTREFNIRNKKVYLLITRGAELRTFKSTVALRAQGSDVFAGSDYSCVLELLLDSEEFAKEV